MPLANFAVGKGVTMADMPSARQEQIMRWLREQGMMSIDELVEKLSVSVMTVHRDLDALVRAGLADKVHGGVVLAENKPQPTPNQQGCDLCHSALTVRTSFVIQTERGEQFQMCCPHCGFLMLSDSHPVASALTRDFIYGRMVNAWQATYLLDSDITLCCMPSILCFASQGDAARLQLGFGGQVLAFADAYRHLLSRHQRVHLSP
jgi:Fe2+ or Zn2+ uptake regulation protein